MVEILVEGKRADCSTLAARNEWQIGRSSQLLQKTEHFCRRRQNKLRRLSSVGKHWQRIGQFGEYRTLSDRLSKERLMCSTFALLLRQSVIDSAGFFPDS
jgi:hypothetical protein